MVFLAASIGMAQMGNPTFLYSPSVSYSPGGTAVSLAVADLYGDGKPDIVVLNCGTDVSCSGTGSVGILLGNGDGTFQPVVSYGTGGTVPLSVAVADVNGDGKPDLVIANCGTQFDCSGNATAGVLIGNGDGTFQNVVTYNLGLGSRALTVADVNGDGIPDIVAGVSGNVAVLLGVGDGTFKPVITSGLLLFVPTSISVADLNGDGKPDVVVSGFCTAENCGGLVDVLGNGDGTFQYPSTYTSGEKYWTESTVVADVNHDGKPDLLVSNVSVPVSVFYGNGDGTFQPAVSLGVQGPQVVFGDVDGDGKPDLIVAGGKIQVLLGNGNGTFGPVVIYDDGNGAGNVALGDVNRDGKVDLAVLDSSGVGVMLNNLGAPSTTTLLVANPSPGTVNQTVTYTATVKGSVGGSLKGTVSFVDVTFPNEHFLIGKAALTNNMATATTSYTFPRAYQVVAAYSGEFETAAMSTSPQATEAVRGASKTVVTTSGSPVLLGQPVTITVVVSSQYASIPDGGVVTLADGTSPFASAVLAGGVARYTTSSLTAGTHHIVATYTGSTLFLPSSGSVRQDVTGHTTSTAAMSSLSTSIYGQTVTWMARVTSTDGVSRPERYNLWTRS